MMKKLHLLQFKKFSLDYAWKSLEQLKVEVLYGMEGEGDEENQIYVYLNEDTYFPFAHWMSTCAPASLPEVDWDAQWRDHSPYYHEGKVHLSFETYGIKANPLQLMPGEGFGDLSHPTTQLMLEMMAQKVEDKTLIDIGCGSGILSLAGIRMGATESFGIDIDPKAIEHSKANACSNALSSHCHFCYPQALPFLLSFRSSMICMNMITSEQQIAWNSVAFLHEHQHPLITSGVQITERKAYLRQANRWGWRVQEEKQKGEWLCFYFL